MRYAILIEYNGSNYQGWQRQRHHNTVQAQLEMALSKFANHDIEINVAGRTDAGVHALGQVATFDTNAHRHLRSWVVATNSLLPEDIKIKEIVMVNDDFHARFSAKARTYHYYLYNGDINSAIFKNIIGYYARPLNLTKMQDAAHLLLGEHDFSAFRTAMCQAKNPVKNLYDINIMKRGLMIRFEFTANSFLHHMIRNIIGALVYIGINKLTINSFIQKIKAKDRGAMPPTFMPQGLYLTKIDYEQDVFTPYISNWIFNL